MIAQVAESRGLSLVSPIPASPFPVGSLVWIKKINPRFREDLGRIGEVKPASSNPELAGQVRVLLQKDVCIRRFAPDQLEVLSSGQSQRIAEWQAKDFLVSRETHEWVQPGEICMRVAKGDVSRLLFVAANGWQETEAQRKRLRAWSAEGRTLTKAVPQYGLPLEIRVDLQGVDLQGVEAYLLSSTGLMIAVSTQRPVSVSVASLEAELSRLQQEEAECLAAGGTSWTVWKGKGVSIQDYAVAKKAKTTGVVTQHHYHRLECNSPIFPKRSDRKSKTANPYAKNRHLAKDEYARYRSAKYRHDAMQDVLQQLEALALAVKAALKPKRSPDSAGHFHGEYQILDTRSLAVGEYPHNTFSFVVGQWRWGKKLKFYHLKSFKYIPVDQPEPIELARTKAQKYLEDL